MLTAGALRGGRALHCGHAAGRPLAACCVRATQRTVTVRRDGMQAASVTANRSRDGERQRGIMGEVRHAHIWTEIDISIRHACPYLHLHSYLHICISPHICISAYLDTPIGRMSTPRIIYIDVYVYIHISIHIYVSIGIFRYIHILIHTQ